MSETKTPRAVKLNEANLRQAEYIRTVYHVKVEPNVTVDDIVKPIFWTHCAGSLRIGDRVEIMPQDSSWFAEFMVMSVGNNWARVAMLRFTKFDSEAPSGAALEEYAIRWGSPTTKNRVIRMKDKSVVRDGFDTREQAQAFIDEIQKAVK